MDVINILLAILGFLYGYFFVNALVKRNTEKERTKGRRAPADIMKPQAATTPPNKIQ